MTSDTCQPSVHYLVIHNQKPNYIVPERTAENMSLVAISLSMYQNVLF